MEAHLPTGPAGSPLVYVTMGTVFNDAGPLRLILQALGALEVRVSQDIAAMPSVDEAAATLESLPGGSAGQA